MEQFSFPALLRPRDFVQESKSRKLLITSATLSVHYTVTLLLAGSSPSSSAKTLCRQDGESDVYSVAAKMAVKTKARCTDCGHLGPSTRAPPWLHCVDRTDVFQPFARTLVTHLQATFADTSLLFSVTGSFFEGSKRDVTSSNKVSHKHQLLKRPALPPLRCFHMVGYYTTQSLSKY